MALEQIGAVFTLSREYTVRSDEAGSGYLYLRAGEKVEATGFLGTHPYGLIYAKLIERPEIKKPVNLPWDPVVLP